MESTLVIKVTYGDTLRRFTTRVNENNCLDLDMAGLRAKVLSLFNFAADAKLLLRYVDEDGDLVTLVDDADLHDVTKQRLKFLRVYVNISNDSGVESNANSSGSSTPSISHPTPKPSLRPRAVIAPDALKNVPEPLREAMLMFATDLLSSSPVVANIADSISEMGFPILNTHSQAHAAAGPSSEKGVPEKSSSSKARGPKSTCVGSHNAGQQMEPENVPGVVPVVIASDAVKNVPESLRECVSNLVDSISKVGLSSLNPHFQAHVEAGLRSNTGAPKKTAYSETRGPWPTCAGSTSNAGQPDSVDLNILPNDPFSLQSTNVNSAPHSPGVPDGEGKKGKRCTGDSLASEGESSGTSPNSAVPNSCPIPTTVMSSGTSIPHPFSRSYTVGRHSFPSFKWSSNYPEVSGMFHKGVRCDGCGIYPITGPRFTSKVRENYDLCSICFNKMGNENDYYRMDFPLPAARVRRSSKGVHEHPMGPPTMPHVFKAGAALKHAKPKLDSRFVLDVNVIDGTMMAPSTAFTKIWRMRNNGTLVWPKGTQLVWIGGDQFSDSHSVYLEFPEDGIPADKELDIAVDFRAPELPGRYISYWRMATSSGQLFGQRVWVLIQVDASLKDSFYVSSQGLNLNIPLDVSGSKAPQIIDINAQPVEDDAFLQNLNADACTEPLGQMADEQPRKELENEFPVDEATNDGPAATPPAASAPPSSVSYPIIDLSATAPAVPSDQQFSVVDAVSSLGTGGSKSVEDTLLKELEEMGFKQVDLNKEILRMNEYNLEQSVDDLCGVSEWDPILEELQEMGFRDNETNKRLLKKNNGSLKRVVMDLINGE